MPLGFRVKFQFPPQMVKIWHFPPGWSRFRFLMVLIWIPFLISPPDGQDLAQICSKCRLQFLRLMALPVIEAFVVERVRTLFFQLIYADQASERSRSRGRRRGANNYFVSSPPPPLLFLPSPLCLISPPFLQTIYSL